MIAHCLFEQSGTFRDEFRKMGIESYDYDIANDYGKTDHIVDLFEEIRGGYEGKKSIFDEIKKEDIILAFFPCTRFECQCSMAFRGEAFQMRDWTDEQRLEYDLKLHKELTANYEAISKLAVLCFRRGLRAIIENPYNQPHYLTSYWALKPKYIDKDRRENGDYFKKPTQYFFINCEPQGNLVFEPLDYVETRNIERMLVNDKSAKVRRSEIHPQYANRFIRQQILKAT